MAWLGINLDILQKFYDLLSTLPTCIYIHEYMLFTTPIKCVSLWVYLLLTKIDFYYIFIYVVYYFSQSIWFFLFFVLKNFKDHGASNCSMSKLYHNFIFGLWCYLPYHIIQGGLQNLSFSLIEHQRYWAVKYTITLCIIKYWILWLLNFAINIIILFMGLPCWAKRLIIQPSMVCKPICLSPKLKFCSCHSKQVFQKSKKQKKKYIQDI